MAIKQQQDLLDVLKSSGIRKKIARGLSKSAGKSDARRSRELSTAADQLRRAAATIDEHAVDPERSQAAKKAARTRKRNAAKRSEAAKRGARTRARSK
jgi:DNA topoisomerase-1